MSKIECFYTVALEPCASTKEQINRLRQYFEPVINDACFNLSCSPLMPLLSFPLGLKIERKLEGLFCYEMGGLKKAGLLEFDGFHFDDERGIVGLKLNIGPELKAAINGLKHALMDVYDVQSQYLSHLESPCLVFAKNLPPFAFDYVKERLKNEQQLNKNGLGYKGFMLKRLKGEKNFMLVKRVPLA